MLSIKAVQTDERTSLILDIHPLLWLRLKYSEAVKSFADNKQQPAVHLSVDYNRKWRKPW